MIPYSKLSMGSSLVALLSLFVTFVTCQDANVTYNVREELPNRSYIGSVGIDSQLFTDISNEEFQKLQFQILTQGNKYAKLFYMETNTSLLFTNSRIDREEFFNCFSDCFIDFHVGVYDQSELTKIIQIKVNIIDYNDNSPEFTSSQQTINISESTPINSVLTFGAAVDLDQGDQNSVQAYRIVPDLDEFQLDIDEVAEEFVLKLKGELDREKKSYYQLLIIAVDGGTPQLTGSLTLQVYVADANDNFPLFSEQLYETSIQENLPLESSILLLSAIDADAGNNGRVSYHFSQRVSDNVMELFHINDSTGELTAAGNIDYELDREFEFQIVAVDHGFLPMTSTADVRITVTDVNDNAPRISINQPLGGTVLTEAAEINSYVSHVEIIDIDSGQNGNFTCQILDNHFKFEYYGNSNYKIVLNKTLDHDAKASHNVTIVCKDYGSPSQESRANFIVHVDDINDNTPIFTKEVYNAEIVENNDPGVSIIDVAAMDKDSAENGRITYSLHPEVEGIFTINSFTGVITANTSLDRETHGDQFIFHVFATDGGEEAMTGTGTVVIMILDENDNAPTFPSDPVTLTVMENQAIGTVVGNISADDPDYGDNGTFFYQFPTDSDIYTYFRFTADGVVMTTRKLDRESKPVHQFNVSAVDMGGRTNSVTVLVEVLDENDNIPEIIYPSNYDNTKYVPKSLPVGAEVLEVTARDYDVGDNADLSYYLKEDNSSETFALNEYNGKLYVNKSLADTDLETTFAFVIEVRDGGSPSHYSLATLNLVIVQGRAGYSSQTGSGMSANMWIVVGIVVATVVLSLIMIAVIIRICWYNRRRAENNKFSDSSDMDPRLIDTSSSASTSSKDSNGNEKVKIQDGCLPSTYLPATEKIDSHLKSLSSVDKNIEAKLYIEQVKQFEYELTKKLDETNSDNSGELGTRDSGQGGSDVDLNSLSESPDIHDFQNMSRHDPVQNSCYHGSLPRNSSNKKDQSDNPVGNHSNRDSDYSVNHMFIPKSDPNFSHTACKTAEKKELSKVRKGTKRVMFSDDLENSHSSGRSSTMSTLSYSDLNTMVDSVTSPRRLNRLYSDETSSRSEDHLNRSNNALRRSADNIEWNGNRNRQSRSLQSDSVNFQNKDQKSTGQRPSERVLREGMGNLMSSPGPVFTLSQNCMDRPNVDTDKTGAKGTSGSHGVNLNSQLSPDDVFPRDLYV